MATVAICPCCGTDLDRDEPINDGRVLSDPNGPCLVDGKVIPLQPNERITLHTLMKAKGAAVHKRAIAERLGYEGDYNIVDVYLSRIRGKLGSHEAIGTLRGRYVCWRGLDASNNHTA